MYPVIKGADQVGIQLQHGAALAAYLSWHRTVRLARAPLLKLMTVRLTEAGRAYRAELRCFDCTRDPATQAWDNGTVIATPFAPLPALWN